MPPGRPTSFHIALTPEQHTVLTAMQRQTTIQAGVMRRARLILLLAAGATVTEAAAKVGLSRNKTSKWIHRWIAKGLDGLNDVPPSRQP
jgi:transposase